MRYFLHNRSDQLSKMTLESPSMEEVPPIYANANDNGKVLLVITLWNNYVLCQCWKDEWCLNNFSGLTWHCIEALFFHYWYVCIIIYSQVIAAVFTVTFNHRSVKNVNLRYIVTFQVVWMTPFNDLFQESGWRQTKMLPLMGCLLYLMNGRLAGTAYI